MKPSFPERAVVSGAVLFGIDPTTINIRKALYNIDENIDFEIDEISMVPLEKVTLDGEDKEMFEKLLGMLDDIEDVQNVYHNVEL